MILRRRPRSPFKSHPGSPGCDSERMARASDIILVMMAGLLVILAAVRILHG
ncbi:hypothetical protein [Rhizobium sullae]|uniref:Uncharacterized protein n=1 Tax=Rhizobium sullae TaxID=50338 RepID=A0ABY5XUQ4_RHISU|nr:hypothetical protein [Rhizobium sullae]UWU18359.1 hypothetical protein N2599_24260 [Rhizobium sullae]